jgi:Tol biopolymer transport system component
MTQDLWQKLKQIFSDTLEHEPAEREAFVREAAKDDPELLSELLRLLAESDRESGLLSRPALARPWARDEGPRFAPETILARRFRVIRFIARGGMGEVYEAEDLELAERVALKAIRRHIAPDSELLALFRKEVQLARRVTHPNVCRIFDLALHEDVPNTTPVMLLSMELLEGQTLSERLRESGPLSFRDALPMIEEIAAGLQAAHDAGIIHGDLKPGNVMLAARSGESGAKPRAVVMDFGMALPATPDSAGPATSRGGTPDYFAPEQARGAAISTATDMYSFALMIADMLGAPRAARLKPDAERMPSRWAQALRRCLEGEPSRRYTRPAELAMTLRRSADYRRRTMIRAAYAMVFAAIAISGAVFLAGRTGSIQGVASRQLLVEGDTVTARCPSPDGRFVAVTSWDTGDLALRDATTGKMKRLTHKPTTWSIQPGGVYSATFSPDGRHIAYEWMNSRTDGELRVIGVDGTGERTLYRNPNAFSTSVLDWSPDGSRVLIKTWLNDNTEPLALVSIADGSAQSLKIPPGTRVREVQFDADGSGIVFSSPKAQNAGSEIHRLDFNGVESTLITSAGNNDSIIGWSPDRRRLIFTSDRRGHPGIWAVAVSQRGAGGDPQELVPDAGRWETLGITRTGSLLYRLDADGTDVYTAVLDLAAGRTVSPPQQVMDRFVGSYAYPSWSEDGRRLMFGSNHDPLHPALIIYEPQTGAKRELQFDFHLLRRAQWVEHGSAIMAFGETRDGVQGQFRIDPATGVAKLFITAKDLESGFEGAWSADGKTEFNRFTDFRRGIFRFQADTREKHVLYVPPPGVDVGLENLALSPDGHTLAFHARNNAAGSAALMLLPVDGGTPRTLLTIRQPEAFIFGSFAWTPDSRRILAVRTMNNRSEIWQVPVDGSTPTRIEFPAMRVAVLRLNPDGKTIAFFQVNPRSEIWMLQHLL